MSYAEINKTWGEFRTAVEGKLLSATAHYTEEEVGAITEAMDQLKALILREES